MLGLYLSLIDEEEKVLFEDIYYKYRNMMYHIALGILHNKTDAEDAVSEAFYRISINFKKYLENSVKSDAYFVIIIRNVSINYYNQNKRRIEHEKFIDPVDEEKLAEEFEPDRITEEILKLPQEYRDVLYFKYIYGYSVKEIANLLDYSTSMIYKRLASAKKLLYDRLKEGGV